MGRKVLWSALLGLAAVAAIVSLPVQILSAPDTAWEKAARMMPGIWMAARIITAALSVFCGIAMLWFWKKSERLAREASEAKKELEAEKNHAEQQAKVLAEFKQSSEERANAQSHQIGRWNSEWQKELTIRSEAEQRAESVAEKLVCALARIKELSTPSLIICWEPDQPTYRHYYVAPPGDPNLNTQFRICVKNESRTKSVHGIKVKMTALTPHELPCVPCHLRLMNNILPAEAPITEFSLSPNDFQFIDVLLQKPGMDVFWILHTVTHIDVKVRAQPYKFTIQATADGGIEASEDFEIFKDGPVWNLRKIPRAPFVLAEAH